jgi:ABC-type glycerol-3-phosphate transport system substrate-binding protein
MRFRSASSTSPARRSLLVAVSATVAALALSGCAPGGVATGGTASATKITAPVTVAQVAKLGKIKLSIWADTLEKPFLAEMIPQFEKKYPNVTVVPTYKSFDDLIATVVNAAASSNPPDLFEGNNGYAVDGTLVKGKLVRPLADIAAAYDWTANGGEANLTAARWNAAGTNFGSGTLYGMSPISEVQGIYYNKKNLAAAGLTPPKSLAELTAELPIVKAAGQVPIMLGDSDQWSATHIYSDIAATKQDPKTIAAWVGGKAGSTFETKGNLEAGNELVRWAKAGYFDSGYNGLTDDEANQKFASGTGTFIIGGSWNSAALGSSDFGVSPIASGGSGGPAQAWHISSRSENVVADAAFLGMLRSPEVAQEILTAAGLLPANTQGVVGTNDVQKQTLENLKLTQAADSQIGYYDWTTSDMLSVIGQQTQELLAGRITSAQFTAKIQATWVAGHKQK